MIKKNDMFLILILLLTAGSWWGYTWWSAQNAGASEVQIWQDKALVGTYPLDASQPVTLPLDSTYGHNVLVIENGAVRMTKSDCPDQVCVRTGAIDKPGQTIVCLPNRVVIEISGSKESPIDDISQ